MSGFNKKLFLAAKEKAANVRSRKCQKPQRSEAANVRSRKCRAAKKKF